MTALRQRELRGGCFEVLAGNASACISPVGPRNAVIAYSVLERKAAGAVNITAPTIPYDNGFKSEIIRAAHRP